MKTIRINDSTYWALKKYAVESRIGNMLEVADMLIKAGYGAMLDKKIDDAQRLEALAQKAEQAEEPVVMPARNKPHQVDDDSAAHAAVDKLNREPTREEIAAAFAEQDAAFKKKTDAYKVKHGDAPARQANQTFAAYTAAADKHPDYPWDDNDTVIKESSMK